MSAPHRGLPLPAALSLTQPPPPPQHGPSRPLPPGPGPGLPPQAQPAHSPHSHNLGPLPPPPQWQGSEESMRHWLLAKVEEERRKQEEEKTQQETLRLEQRRIEHDILRTSLDRGVPPPMVPVVFAGLTGGHLAQATLEWVQQYLPHPQQPHSAHIAPIQGSGSPGPRRESQQYPPYPGSAGVPPTPGLAAALQGGFVSYQGPGSPNRPRAHTIGPAGTAPRPLGALAGSALPRLSTGESVTGLSHGSHASSQQQGSAAQSETQSPSIYFHHWQPPASHGSSGQQASSSADSPKKRKAAGPHQAAPPPNQRRSKSPATQPQPSTSSLSNPPAGRRRGHSRQRSDISAYRSAGRSRGESFAHHGGFSPGLATPVVGTSRETTFAEPYQHPRGSHSVSSLLSDQPSSRYPPDTRAPGHSPEGGRHSRATSEERARAGPPAPPSSSARRERAGKDQ